MICAGCLEDVGYSVIAYDDGDELYCDWCWRRVKDKVQARNARYKAIGHTGSDMCGCEMCASAYERE